MPLILLIHITIATASALLFAEAAVSAGRRRVSFIRLHAAMLLVIVSGFIAAISSRLTLTSYCSRLGVYLALTVAIYAYIYRKSSAKPKTFMHHTTQWFGLSLLSVLAFI